MPKQNIRKDNSDNELVDGLRLAGEVDNSKTGESVAETFKEKEFEQPTLYSFIYPPQDVERAIKRSRFLECKRQIIILLSKKPMEMRRLWIELTAYHDIREAVLTKLKLEKVVKIRWYANPLDEKGEYYLAKRKTKRT